MKKSSFWAYKHLRVEHPLHINLPINSAMMLMWVFGCCMRYPKYGVSWELGSSVGTFLTTESLSLWQFGDVLNFWKGGQTSKAPMEEATTGKWLLHLLIPLLHGSKYHLQTMKFKRPNALELCVVTKMESHMYDFFCFDWLKNIVFWQSYKILNCLDFRYFFGSIE